ncbi:hypothetical protein [Streptomyces sp. NPDC058867]|uniref:hypothetical protein n=1 Tax=unclassified Streptomyces TaxID=2593676 RepID=UPI0036790188
MAEASVPRPARTRPLLFAVLESLLTGACALVRSALAGLLHPENRAHEPWEPTYPPAGPFYLLAFSAAVSLVVTWVPRCLPGRALRRTVDRLILVRAGLVIAVCVGAFGFAVVY